jgi:tetratricopeptide (TPR) repeat protein
MARPAADRDPPTPTAGFAVPDPGRPATWDGPSLLAGRYQLLAPIGEGGMGTVYRAEQVRPVRRTVAVKLIKPGMDSRAVLTRFEAERQALALMDHPHISKVLDAGATPDGRPFFVMELVTGVPLTDYCDTHRVPVADRLDLFRQVCQAIQHAHQKGVIHRDLKPSNILVETQDGKPVPKVIDFGLAKAVGGVSLTEQTLFSTPGSVVGTPLYMAPEQAGRNTEDVDTRADVYALGAVLYELLTGSTPIRRDTLRHAALDELLRVIREEEPPLPSSRLSSPDTPPAVAADRGTEPARLGRFVRGDLDRVVMKALEKDRDRRYGSAAAFADDVGRLLNHEPVTAGPPTAAYRVRKFVRRNRAAVTAAGLLLLALVAGVVGTTWGLVRADSQRVRAEQATDRAERSSERAARALYSLTDEALDGLLGRQAVWGEKERAFLKTVENQLDQLAATEGETESVRRMRASAHLRLASVRALLGDLKAAEADNRSAAAQFDALPSPSDRANAAQARRRLGQLLANTGKYPEALIEYASAEDTYNRLAEADPTEAMYRFHAAVTRTEAGYTHTQAGDLDAAEKAGRAAAAMLGELAAAHPSNTSIRLEQARAYSNLFTVLRRTQRPAEAEQTIDEAIKLYRAAPDHRDPRVRVALGKALQSKTAVHADRANFAAAESPGREALSVLAGLAADYPAVPEYRHELARAQVNLAAIYSRLDRTDAAVSAYRDAASTALSLADNHPKIIEYRLTLARARLAIGIELEVGGRHKEAEAVLADAVLVWEKLYADNPNSPSHATGLVGTLARLGISIDNQKDHLRARTILERAEKLMVASPQLLARDPNGPNAELAVLTFLVQTLVNLGDHAGASSRADRLAALADSQGGEAAYNAGRYLARCSTLATKDQVIPAEKRSGLANEYAGRAVKHLQAAVSRGFCDAKLYANDTDLNPLRDRDDFKKLIADLEAKVRSK